jgi:hypothetical protein
MVELINPPRVPSALNVAFFTNPSQHIMGQEKTRLMEELVRQLRQPGARLPSQQARYRTSHVGVTARLGQLPGRPVLASEQLAGFCIIENDLFRCIPFELAIDEHRNKPEVAWDG